MVIIVEGSGWVRAPDHMEKPFTSPLPRLTALPFPPTPTVGSSSNPSCLSRWLWRKQQLPLCRSAAKILHREAADKVPGTARSISRPSAMGRNSFYLALKVKIPSVLCVGLIVGLWSGHKGGRENLESL